ncbi:MAG TPA: zinc-ribbon domain-containing protein [Rhodothermales bacterium]|nr:zinc-ribbon domain-containing protein [Rhodothermales bacterium]
MVKNSTAEVCADCGARVEPGAEVCDLCGRPLHDTVEQRSDVEAAPEGSAAPAPRPVQAAGAFCNACGWKNPPGARFCSQCGSSLQDLASGSLPVESRNGTGPIAPGRTLPDAGAAASDEDKNAVTRQVAILTAAGVLLVVALYLITLFSKSVSPSSTAEAQSPAASEQVAAEAAAPLPPDLAKQAGVLEQEIEQASGSARLEKQRQLVTFYLTANRLDLAATEQEKIAETVDTPEEWALAGNYYYSVMEQTEGLGKMDAGRNAIAAYRKVLDKQPDNLGVRTDLATALLSTNNPMEGVRQIKQVLAVDPNHVQANFNYGVMLSMIGRVDQALTQFEKVKSLVPPGSDNYVKAENAIEILRKGSGT